MRGQRHVLKNIKRRRAPNSQAFFPQQAIGSGSDVGTFGLDEVGRLKHEKQVLTMELMKLRQQQQNTRAQLQAMEVRLQGTEKKQQKMMSFLAKAMQNPDFIQKLVQNGKIKELEEAFMKQTRELRGVNNGESSQTSGGSKLIKSEPEEFGDSSGFQVSELEALALEIQGFGRSKRNQEEEPDEFEGGERELDDEFWEELFSERSDITGVDDVNFLAEKLDFLGSNPK